MSGSQTRRWTLGVAAILSAALASPGCKDGKPKAADEAEDPAGCGDPIDPGPTPIRRMTRTEYNNTVFQLLGDGSRPADAFVPDEEALGFDNQADALVVSPLLAEQYLSAAEQLGASHAAKFARKLDSCGSASARCSESARAWLTDFGQRAFRRPLTDAELDDFTALFEDGAALSDDGFDAEAGIELVLAALLQSPHFLYRVEFGGEVLEDESVVPLTSWEMASRLSYLLWQSMPDEPLFEAAAAGELLTRDSIEEHARRLLAAPRAREAVKSFHRQWLLLGEIESVASSGRDPEFYPDYDEDILPLLQRETEEFLDYAIFEEDASFEALFTAPYSLMNAEVAEFYGIDNGPVGNKFIRVDLDPKRSSGFMTQAGLLMLHAKPDRSSPVHRGLFVREHLLCQVPPPPPDVVPEAPTVDTSKTTREQFAEHTNDPACAGCHMLIDPVGHGFEHYDAMGRYREQENGLPIDASGEVLGTRDADGEFDGVLELSERLAASEQVRDCVATQWFRYAYGRAETDADACSVSQIRTAFAESEYDIKELLVALTLSDAFRFRKEGP